MLDMDLDRVRANIREASTGDLLDRLTVFAAGMEPIALDLIEAELRQRGLRSQDIEAHAEKRKREVRILPDGTAVRCSFCHQPAVAEGWGWHCLFDKLPIFPRYYYYCEEHQPDS